MSMEVGDYLPAFRLPSTIGEPLSTDDFVGKPAVIFFYIKDGGDFCKSEACGFRDLFAEFQQLGVQVIGIGIESEASQRELALAHHLLFPLLSDIDGQTFKRFGALRHTALDGKTILSPQRATYLFGPNFRVAKIYADSQSANHPKEVLEDARRLLSRDEPRRMIGHAPILMIPDALPLDLCKSLIQLWETDNGDSGFMRQVNGKTVGVFDYSHKIRRDHFMTAGKLQTQVEGYLSRRVIPEIHTAFNYVVSRREDIRIACYDASKGGYFRPHRDNTTEGTAHRRFAISLLLNNDYDGGFLRFPEYGGHTYRPEAGGAIVFSCSLLHEATDITAGRRFVLLSFFYGEAEAKAREAYNKRTGGDYRS